MIVTGCYAWELRRWEQAGDAWFLTFSCHRRLPLFDSVWLRDALAASLRAARVRCGFELRAWVVMPERVHLIVRRDVQRRPVPRVLRAIKQPVAQAALSRWKQVNAPVLAELRVSSGASRFWQAGGGFDRNLRGQDDLEEKVMYVNNNPVKRGLVEHPAEWAWSSARWYAGNRDGEIPIDAVGRLARLRLTERGYVVLPVAQARVAGRSHAGAEPGSAQAI